VGTTRSRVSFFMNKFRKLGFVNYDNGHHLRVHNSLLSVVLNDDGGTGTSGTTTANSKKALEPPSEPGGPPEKERAHRPPLPSPNVNGNERSQVEDLNCGCRRTPGAQTRLRSLVSNGSGRRRLKACLQVSANDIAHNVSAGCARRSWVRMTGFFQPRAWCSESLPRMRIIAAY